MPPYFTSQPPVYARNWANGQNLVESTKIERQIVSKKVHRKEKKETKKEKKPKNEKKSLKQQYFPAKQVSDESEQHEKSCLTAEHEQPYVGYLSDGSQTSKKRRRENSPAVVESQQIQARSVAGNPLRIRFVFKKPKEAEVVPQEDRVCSTSGTERPREIPSSVSPPNTSDQEENLLSTSLQSDKITVPSESKKRKKHKPSKESVYNSLFDDWVPPCLSLEEDESNSDDWLFGSSRQNNPSTKASIKNDEDMIKKNLQTSENFASFPRARFLPEVGIFSLPYTVPF